MKNIVRALRCSFLCVEEKIFEIRDTRYEIRDTRYEIRDTRYEIFLKIEQSRQVKMPNIVVQFFNSIETKKAELMLGFLY
ncbi:hypothetical protein CWN83_21620 [Vibrio splendidus]|nr:hypothetical protein CWN83_21620 [Vibrio splendidus]